MKVLVADDSKPIRERLVERLLRLPDVQVAEAVDTPDALRQLKDFNPDVAVFDIRMPGGGGIKALSVIKKDFPAVTVIVMTSYPYAQYRRKCLEAGADFFFDKSTEFEQIAETILQLQDSGNVHEVARRTAAAQLVAAKEALEKETQRRRDMGILSLLQKPIEKNDADQAYSMWEKTFDAMPDLVAILDAGHTIVRVNKAMADRLGVPAAELAGKKCYEYMHGISCPVSGCPHQALLKDHQEHTSELYDEHMGGWFEVSVSPVFDRDKLIGAIHVARDITDRKQAEALARNTLDALSAHICIVNETGIILSVNRSWTKFAEANQVLFGTGSGSNYLAVCDRAKGAHENEARQFSEGLRAVLGGKINFFEMEYPCETETELFWFCGRVTPFAGEGPRLVAIAHEDITDRKRAEAALRASELRYRQLFESMQTGFALHEILCDENGVPCDYRFLEVNAAFEALTGLKAAEIVGRTVKDVLPETEPVWIETYGRVALTGQSIQIEDFSGTLGRHYSVSAYSPRNGQFATIFTDITEQKNAEDAVRRARDAAEEANRAKTQFLANMSHELRTPLNAVIGLSELLMDSPLNTEQLDYVQTINTSGEDLLKIIADLLDLSKIEMGKLKVKVEPFAIRSVVDKSIALLTSLANKKGLELSAVVDVSVQETMTGDADRLQQVLINLINNAIKFTEAGFVHLKVKEYITLSGSRCVEFSVEDSGCGMDAETLKRIFEPFQQGDSSTTREYGGSGLGLAISKNLVEMMGGAIQVKSVTGEGSVFNFHIVDQAASQHPVPVGDVRDQWRGRCACVWGDDPADMRAAEVFLERIGVMPRYKTSLDEINLILSLDDPADVVLCNLDLPGLRERLLEFRKIRPDVPWIGFSNWMTPLDESVKACFSAFIDRPLKAEPLYGALMKISETNV